MSVYFTLMILVTFFTIYFKQIFKKKNILYLLLSVALILLLTAAFWVPLLEIKIKGDYPIFTPYLLTAKGDLRFSTLNIVELFQFTGFKEGTMIFHAPFFINIILIVSIFLAVKKKIWKKKEWLFIFLFTILSLIMITKLFPWYYTPSILQTLQFPWRLTLYLMFGICLIVGIFINNFSGRKNFSKICIIFAVIVLFSTFYYIGHLDKEVLDGNNIDYSRGMGNESEYLPGNSFKDKEYVKNRTNDIIIKSGNRRV